jgi:hypothetical protein
MPHTVVMAIVEWLEKKEANPENFEHIDSAFLRCARFRAFVDFPNGPVAIRDADTIFFKYYKDFTAAHVLEAEVTFWNAFLKRPERFSISSQKEYKNQFHTDALCGNYRITPGTFAGFVNSKGGIQEWTDSGLFWKECMDYIRARDHIHVSKEPQVYIGKDEQILLFRIIPKLFERIFFFHLEYTDKAELTAPPPKGLGIQLLSAKYNEIVFSEPTFAANLKSTFAKQIANYLRVCGIV